MQLLHFLLLNIIALSALPNKDVEVKFLKEGNDALLTCKGVSGKACAWIKHEVGSAVTIVVSGRIITKERYTLVDRPQLGDCSLLIKETVIEDSGNLSCKILPAHRAISNYNLIVGVTPQIPFIKYKGQKLRNDILNPVSADDSGITEVQCVVANGLPEAVVTWDNVHDSDKANLTVKTLGQLRTVINTLWIKIDSNETTSTERSLKCNAQHSLYSQFTETVTARIALFYPSRKVTAVYDPVSQNASCKVDNVANAEFVWAFRSSSDETWTDYSHKPNITLTKKGKYRCKARDSSKHGLWMESLMTITFNQDNTKSDKELNDTSMSVGKVLVKTEWAESTVGDNVTCVHERGEPLPKVKWFFKKHLEPQWTIVSTDQTITINSTGLFYCETKQIGGWVKSSNRIFVRNECMC